MKIHRGKVDILFFILAILMPLFHPGVTAQDESRLSTMPRIDVHAHVGCVESMADYMEVRNILKEQYHTDLAMWLDLSFPMGPGEKGLDILQSDEEIYQGRFLPTINDYKNAMKLYPRVKEVLVNLGYTVN